MPLARSPSPPAQLPIADGDTVVAVEAVDIPLCGSVAVTPDPEDPELAALLADDIFSPPLPGPPPASPPPQPAAAEAKPDRPKYRAVSEPGVAGEGGKGGAAGAGEGEWGGASTRAPLGAKSPRSKPRQQLADIDKGLPERWVWQSDVLDDL